MADELNTAWTEPAAPLAEGVPPTEEDRLSEAGIFRHGYGLIPKYAMQDRELSITAKAIYAYLCSLCGGGETAFPGVDTIRAALGLGKDAYYQHRRQLEEAGYITVWRRHRGKAFTSNLYILNANPKRFQGEPEGAWENRVFAAVRFHGLRGAGYGVLPRAVMTDSRLDAKAKALYAYFASFTGAGVCAFPSQARMLRDLGVSQPAYYKYLNQLKRAGYLRTVQRRQKNRFAVNEYYLLDGTPTEPQTAAQPQKGVQTETQPQTEAQAEAASLAATEADLSPFAKNPDIMLPYPKNPDIIKPVIMEPDTINPDTTNNKSRTNNKNYINNKLSAINLSAAPPNPVETGETGSHQIDRWREEEGQIQDNQRQKQENSRKNQRNPEQKQGQKNREQEPNRRESRKQAEFLEELKQTCGYEDIPIMYPRQDMSLIDNLLSIMAAAVCGRNSLRLYGRRVSREEARERFLSLKAEHLLYVLRCVREQDGIRNLRAYYLTALWNAPETMELYYNHVVERDLATDRESGAYSHTFTDEEIAEWRRYVEESREQQTLYDEEDKNCDSTSVLQK